MTRVSILSEKYGQLSDKERQEFDNYLLVRFEDQATTLRQDYELAMLGDYYQEIEEAYASWGKMCGISTGYRNIDKMTMGLVGGEVVVIGGATSTGKTALAVNIAINVALQRRNVLFVTLEMTKRQLGMRIKHITNSETDYDFCLPHILFQLRDELNWQSIDGLMQKAVQEAGVELVVIDHLHYFTRELRNVAEDLGNITKEFKKNSIRHNVPVILLSHTRKSDRSNDTATGINDLRGSSYIAQDADIVLMVDRDSDIENKISITISKNRNRYGVPIGTTELLDFDATKITESATHFPS